MAQIIAMGETVLDILFKNNQPVAAVPGGSSFNSIISVGRSGLPCSFVGYTGGDIVGQQTIEFLRENHVGTAFFEQRADEKSAISLAYLNEEGDAHYVFYKPIPKVSENFTTPQFNRGDVLLFGSYYACCNGMRPQVTEIVRQAHLGKAIVYYDINFRASHRQELDDLATNIQWNMCHSTIVRGSADDFEVMYGMRDAVAIYEKYIRDYCNIFICTGGAGLITICTPSQTMQFQTPKIEDIVSTVGAGDNFNAGFIYGLVCGHIDRETLCHLDAKGWNGLIRWACAFAGEACRSTNNYISKLPSCPS